MLWRLIRSGDVNNVGPIGFTVNFCMCMLLLDSFRKTKCVRPMIMPKTSGVVVPKSTLIKPAALFISHQYNFECCRPVEREFILSGRLWCNLENS